MNDSQKRNGGHAFPTTFVEPEHGSTYAGMTLRDYFAARIAQGDAVGTSDDCDGWSTGVSDETIQKRVNLYFRIADAMVARSKTK